MSEELERGQFEAVLETRRELGSAYDAELVAGFAERIERAVDQRVADEISTRHQADGAQLVAGKRQTALGIVSVVAGIPITLPLGLTDNLVPLLVAWAGLVGVNIAHAWQSQRRV